MGQVVYHNFGAKSHSQATDTVTEAEAYIIKLAAELDEQDFWDFAEVVNDPSLYDQLDQELKELVNGFWACNCA